MIFTALLKFPSPCTIQNVLQASQEDEFLLQYYVKANRRFLKEFGLSQNEMFVLQSYINK